MTGCPFHPTPPKPEPRAERVSLLTYLRLFRRDILSAQPARLYRAWMAEFRTPFFRSYMVNDPALVARVLNERPDDFPKSNRIREGLLPLLGNSVFVTNGEVWKRQRRIIDPAFEGGRLKDTFPAMLAAGLEGIEKRMQPPAPAEEDLYHVDNVRAGLDTLPGDLGQAIEALKQDEVIQDALGVHVYERYVEAKLLEWTEYRLQVSRWELDRYLMLY